MNFKNQADKLENFLNEEFKKNAPLVELADKSLVYKNYRIKQSKVKTWDLCHIATNDIIDTFRFKATAALAARHYFYNRFDLYNTVKNLDIGYWNNSIDSLNFKNRYLNAKDIERKDIYLARWDLTYQRSKVQKEEITRMFINSF
jgi:hypothetical protein